MSHQFDIDGHQITVSTSADITQLLGLHTDRLEVTGFDIEIEDARTMEEMLRYAYHPWDELEQRLKENGFRRADMACGNGVTRVQYEFPKDGNSPAIHYENALRIIEQYAVERDGHKLWTEEPQPELRQLAPASSAASETLTGNPADTLPISLKGRGR